MTRIIILVEDNPQNRYLATFLLEHHGYTVMTAVDGNSTLALVDHVQPLAILLDIQLPGMDGYELAHTLRSLPRLANVSLIAVTACAMTGDRHKALVAGCDGYIEKPINPGTFVTDIEAIISSRAPHEKP